MRFSLRTAFAGLALLCAALAITRAVIRSITPITVTADRPDVIAYLDGEEVGPVPAKISWSRLYGLYGLSGTGPFDDLALDYRFHGMFLRSVRRLDGGCPIIYLKPADEANAVRDGLVLVDSPYGRIVKPQIGNWSRHHRVAHFRADLPRDPAPRARIDRAELLDDGLAYVHMTFPLSEEALRAAAGQQVQIILSRGTFTDWRFVQKGEWVDVAMLTHENDMLCHAMTIEGDYDDVFQWVHATVTNSSGYRIAGMAYEVRTVTLRDGKLLSSSESDSAVGESEALGSQVSENRE